MRNLTAPALRRRLSATSQGPVAVALSGGGDSLALLLLADAWARTTRRTLMVLTVDHGLQPDGAIWADQCRARATALGWPHRTLLWIGDKPTTGLPAAARLARHRLLAEAAREAGATVILLGHTADDILEAAAMRAAGSTTPDPREWSPSPVWPEGRGVFLLRPLLDIRRSEIRAWLTGRGEVWIEDPANVDLKFARARARRQGVEETGSSAPFQPLDLARRAADTLGMIAVARTDLRAAEPEDAARFIRLAAVCAGGGARPPASASAVSIAHALRGDRPVRRSLAGARIEADGETLRIYREPGEARRGGLSTLPCARDGDIWDGRFLLRLETPTEVRRLDGLITALPMEQRHALAALPSRARAGLPASLDPTGTPNCLALDGRAHSLVGDRLAAAAGLIDREPD